jgi:hypothetical protein
LLSDPLDQLVGLDGLLGRSQRVGRRRIGPAQPCARATVSVIPKQVGLPLSAGLFTTPLSIDQTVDQAVHVHHVIHNHHS